MLIVRKFETRNSPVDGVCSDFVPELIIAYPILYHQRSEDKRDKLIILKDART